MRNLTLLALLLGGCAGNQTVVWLLDVAPTADVTRDSQCTENFNVGECPADPTEPTSGWTTEDTSSSSDRLVFVELIQGPGKDGWLVAQDSIVPGTRDGKTWTFTWDQYAEDENIDRHASGYFYREYQRDTLTTTLTMTADGGSSATGTLQLEQQSVDEWSESDTWDEGETGVYNGQIDAYYYLDGGADNDSDVTDCAGDCAMSFTTTLTGHTTFTATRTHADESTFPAIEDAAAGTD